MVLSEVVQYAWQQSVLSSIEANVSQWPPIFGIFEKKSLETGYPISQIVGAPKSDDRRVGSRISQQNHLPFGSLITHHLDVGGRRVEVLARTSSRRSRHRVAIPVFDVFMGLIRNVLGELLQKVCRLVVPMRQQYVRSAPAVRI